jgi:Transposase DDE domain
MARVKVLPTLWHALTAVRRWVRIDCRISTSRSHRLTPSIWFANRAGSLRIFLTNDFCLSFSSLLIFVFILILIYRTHGFEQLNQPQRFAVLASQFVSLRGGVAINSCLVAQYLDADLDRAGVSFADARLQIVQHLFAPCVVELAEFLHRQRGLAPDRLLEGLTARMNRKRKKKTSNEDWQSPWDPDAKIAKMKDGRTHLAYKAEHAVDLETGALIAVTLQDTDQGNTTTIIETVIAPAEQSEDAQAAVPTPQRLAKIIADKGYHSNQIMLELGAVGLRAYVAEPDRGRRDWSKEPAAQTLVYANRRRLRGARGRRLMRQRGEPVERSFAHLYDTGGMRRTYLRGHTNILKRLLIHAGGFNLGLLMRHLIGFGTPRGLRDRLATIMAALWPLLGATRRWLVAIFAWHPLIEAVSWFPPSPIFTNRYSAT